MLKIARYLALGVNNLAEVSVVTCATTADQLTRSDLESAGWVGNEPVRMRDYPHSSYSIILTHNKHHSSRHEHYSCQIQMSVFNIVYSTVAE